MQREGDMEISSLAGVGGLRERGTAVVSVHGIRKFTIRQYKIRTVI
jgi:hypothetical protein